MPFDDNFPLSAFPLWLLADFFEVIAQNKVEKYSLIKSVWTFFTIKAEGEKNRATLTTKNMQPL